MAVAVAAMAVATVAVAMSVAAGVVAVALAAVAAIRGYGCGCVCGQPSTRQKQARSARSQKSWFSGKKMTPLQSRRVSSNRQPTISRNKELDKEFV